MSRCFSQCCSNVMLCVVLAETPQLDTCLVHSFTIAPCQREGQSRKLTALLASLRSMKVVLIGKYLSHFFERFVLLKVQLRE
jgi:hypothetical protein